jgi:hypothetical protein
MAGGTYHRLYSLAGLPVMVRCCQPTQAEALGRLWQRLFALGSAREAKVYLDFQAPTESWAAPCGEEVYSSASLRVLRTDKGFLLRCGASHLELDLAGSYGLGVLDEGFWWQPVYDQREFFLLALMMLLRPHGGYGLHANALVTEEEGFLLVGKPGSGKTTLALSLIRQGWRYLSDDAVVLRQAEEGVEALAFRRGFSCTPETLGRLGLDEPRLEALYSAPGKRVMDLEALFPEGFALSCRPGTVLFPRIANQAKSELTPMKQSDALIALMRESAGIMTDIASSREQLEVLKRLVEQSRCYRLELGSDVYDEAATVSAILHKA